MGGMLPRARKTLKHLRAVFGRGVALRPVLLWGLALWLAVAAVPAAFLYPDEAVTLPVLCLLWASPLGMIVASLSGEAFAVLGAGLAGLLPALIACPELQGTRTTGPVQALLVALLALGFVAASWRHTAAGEPPRPPLWRLLPKHAPLPALLTWLVGAVWLVLAWFPASAAPGQAGAARSVRVAGVAVCWLAVRLLPLRGRTVPGGNERWFAFAGRRALGLLLFCGLLWAAQRTP